MRTLIPWRRSAGLLEPFQREMEDLFERFFEPFEKKGNGKIQVWAPRVDVEETDKEYLVKTDLPGVDPKDIEITMMEGALILKGEKKEEKEEKKKDYHRVERFLGQFYREIPLPAGVDANKITATSAKGVITVTIPRSRKSNRRRLPSKRRIDGQLVKRTAPYLGVVLLPGGKKIRRHHVSRSRGCCSAVGRATERSSLS